jgi:hypothetical protein
MGLKGYRLWAMGQLDSTCSAPPLVRVVQEIRQLVRLEVLLVVAVQLAFVKSKGF